MLETMCFLWRGNEEWWCWGFFVFVFVPLKHVQLSVPHFGEIPRGSRRFLSLLEQLSGLLHLLPCICFCQHRILTAVLILTWLWLSFPSPGWQVCRAPACKPSSQLDWEWLKGDGGASPFVLLLLGLIACTMQRGLYRRSSLFTFLSDAGCCNSRGQSSARILNFQMSCSMAEQVTCMPCCT